MQPTDTTCPVSEQRLRKIRDYIATRVPFIPEGRKIVVDEKAVEQLLPQALRDTAGPVRIFLNSKVIALNAQKIDQLKKILMQQFNKAAGNLLFDASDFEHESAAPKRTLLMAAPTKAPVEFSLHERMEIFRSWYCIRHALVKAGAHLETIPDSPKAGGGREVFTRDRYVMINGIAYLPDTKKLRDIDDAADEKDYIGEVRQVEKALQERGVKTVIVNDAWFEGGNVTRHFGSRTIFVGMDGDWSSAESAQKLLDAINANEEKPWSVVNVPLTNYPEMYHTDTGMSEELPRGEIMLSDRLTDPQTYQQIISIAGRKNIIHLDSNEASLLATNFIDVGNTLVLTERCDSLKKKLAKRGYAVVMPNDYNERTFEMGGGGVHCMTNDVPKKHRCTLRRHPSPGV